MSKLFANQEIFKLIKAKLINNIKQNPITLIQAYIVTYCVILLFAMFVLLTNDWKYFHSTHGNGKQISSPVQSHILNLLLSSMYLGSNKYLYICRPRFVSCSCHAYTFSAAHPVPTAIEAMATKKKQINNYIGCLSIKQQTVKRFQG